MSAAPRTGMDEYRSLKRGIAWLGAASVAMRATALVSIVVVFRLALELRLPDLLPARTPPV